VGRVPSRSNVETEDQVCNNFARFKGTGEVAIARGTAKHCERPKSVIYQLMHKRVALKEY
jgi:hypothetical protein